MTYFVRIIESQSTSPVTRSLKATTKRGALLEAKRHWGGQQPDGTIAVFDQDPHTDPAAFPIAILRSDRWVDPIASAMGSRGGRRGGKAKSAAKVAAARANGAKGGRPRKASK